MAQDIYDLIVIGGGSAGLVGAKFAGGLGLKVALIEMEHIGGDCTWRGCVPSKALLKVGKTAHAARAGAHYGISTEPPTVDMHRVHDYIHSVIENIYVHETPEAVREAGVDPYIGRAQFTSPHTIDVTLNTGETVTLRGKKFVIATGATAAKLPIPGLDDVPYHTYQTLFDNTTLPRRMITIGAGPIGMEMSQAYSRLGAEVTIVTDKVLQHDEPEAGKVMQRVFEREGIRFEFGMVSQVEQNGDEITVHVGDDKLLSGDMLLVAVGRVPNVSSLNLETAGVQFTKHGIQADDNLRTTADHIYAAGDILGGPQFTHYAGFQGYVAARNALLPGASKGIKEVIPWTTFTEPEVAHVGKTEAQARDVYGDAVQVKHFDLKDGDRSQAENDIDGFIKIVHHNGKLLGATVVANRAGEMINEYTIALTNGWGVGDLSNSMHVYPTYGQIIESVSSKMKVEQLLNGIGGQVLKVARRVLF
jgi:pyruvate/2-oxoglutarate dehydrogenase complex dihydrolipoamide dehydrogenase (E3) component